MNKAEARCRTLWQAVSPLVHPLEAKPVFRTHVARHRRFWNEFPDQPLVIAPLWEKILTMHYGLTALLLGFLFVGCATPRAERPPPANDTEEGAEPVPAPPTGPRAEPPEETGAEPPGGLGGAEAPGETGAEPRTGDVEGEGAEPPGETGAKSANGDVGGAGARPDEESTRGFPWPPPTPTSKTLIPARYLPSPSPDTTLGQVSDRLSEALQAQGYGEMRWFSVPQGFALVTQLERIKPDGTPVPVPMRWVGDVPIRMGGLKGYLRGLGLFRVPPGRFRIIVFLVTSAPVSPEGTVTREEARDWMHTGGTSLDEAIASQSFTPRHKVQTLIYEFLKSGPDAPPVLLEHSDLPAMDHLKAAGLLSALGAPR